MERVAIFITDSNGGYPVPASKGGAVSTLVEQLVAENEKSNIVDMTIISTYDAKAEKLSKQYPNIHFSWIKVPKLVKLLDKCAFGVIKNIFKKKKIVSYRSLFSLIHYIIYAKEVLKKESFDKIVLENNIPMAWIIKLSKYSGDYYYHFHNVPRINGKCKEVFEACNGYFCVSDFVGLQIGSKENPIGPINANKIHTLYNCIDTDLFYPRKIAGATRTQIFEKFNISENERVIVFVGRLSEEKGIDKILEAMRFVETENVKLIIAGSLLYNANIRDEYQDRLHILAEQVKDKVVFAGYINQEELPYLYSVADISVLPSMWDEPAGLTMIEAMACGTPVITTASGGISEYVGDCAVVLDRDVNLVKNIAYKIDNILQNENYAHEMGQNAAKRIKLKFSLENYLKNFVECMTK